VIDERQESHAKPGHGLFEWGRRCTSTAARRRVGIWGEWAGAPAGHRARRLADGTLEMSAPAGLGEPAEAKVEPAFAAPAPIASKGPGEPARSLDSLSAAKRKLLAKRIRGER
jgi:hypothetical protein